MGLRIGWEYKRFLPLIIFLAVIFNIGLSQAGTLCADGQIILRLSSATNAHGEVWNGAGNYPIEICYDKIFGTSGNGVRTCTGSNKIVGLSSSTNAHAEEPIQTNYPTQVCYDDLSCVARTSGCQTGESLVVSLSSNTNAHLASDASYPVDICCSTGVIPPSCDNDGICDAGENSTNCPQDCPVIVCDNDGICDTGEDSTNCPLDCPGPCVLNSASWDVNETVEGHLVHLEVTTTNCQGQELSFEIKERDTLSANDPVMVNPANVIIALDGGVTIANWVAEWQAEGWPESDPPEYYFKATIVSTGENRESSNELKVYQQPPPICESIVTCSSYGNQYDCENDICVVADNGVPNGVNCSSPSIDCSCSWNTITTNCSSSVTYGPPGMANVCGNGVLEGGEQCEDGNVVSGDGCSSTCIDEVLGVVCGNDILEGNEVCDGIQLSGLDSDCNLYDDFTSGTLTCEANCLNFNWDSCNPNVCGNGVVEGTEQCDDGNTVNGDGCSSTCIDEVPGVVCGNDILEGNEVCDGIQLSGLDSDCNLYDDFTSGTLTCEADCLNFNWDVCNSNGGGGGGDIGTCYYTEETADTCEDDGYLTVNLIATWIWDPGCNVTCQTENQGIAASCQSTTEVFQCPAQIPLPVFGFYNFLAALVLIAAIYWAISLRKKGKK